MRIQEIEMPPELLANIFDRLPQDDRCNARLSCREFRDVLQLPQFYRTKSFTIIGQDEEERQRISRYLRLYGSFLKHMSISVEAYKKRHQSKAQRRRVTSELLELFNTEQLWSLNCHDLCGLYRIAYHHKYKPSGEHESVLNALAQMLQRQVRLSEVSFTYAFLEEEEGCRLLQALATSSSASRLTYLTLRHFFHNHVAVDLCPVFLELMGRLQNLVNLELMYRCMSATVLAALTTNSTSLRNILLYMNENDNTLPSTLPDWKLATKKRPELQVWVKMGVITPDWNYQGYLLPEMPLVGFSLDRDWFEEPGSNIERDVTDVTGCLIHHRVKSLILNLQTYCLSEGPMTCPEALVALVKACPCLSLLCLQMTVTIDTVLRLAAAANPQSREGEEEEEGVHTATPFAPRIQIHVSRNIVITKSVWDRLWSTNRSCVILNCSGCEPVVSKAGFIE